MEKYTLMIHGGAGTIGNVDAYRQSIRAILSEGEQKLKSGAQAIDVVEFAVQLLEDDPLFNAGRGSVLDARGRVECDAGIMDGRTFDAGSVAGIRNIRNPISLAKCVMDKSEHVFLIGDGAMTFGERFGFTTEPDEYFITDARVRQLEEARKQNVAVLDHSSLEDDADEKKYGTVGAVACDQNGNVAAATSTGGIVNKQFGRIGDSPIIGSGVYADNETCAVSATGYGEQFIRTVLAKTVADIISYKGKSVEDATKEGVAYLVRRVKGLGGIIVVGPDGSYSAAHSTPDMIHGVVTSQEGVKVLF